MITPFRFMPVDNIKSYLNTFRVFSRMHLAFYILALFLCIRQSPVDGDHNDDDFPRCFPMENNENP